MQVRAINIAAYLLLFVFAVLPLAAGFGYAFMYSIGLTGALQTGLTFEHWQKLFTDDHVLGSFGYSAMIALFSLLLSVSAALFVSLKYPRSFSKGLLSYLIYLPLAFPAMVAAFFFFQFMSKAGILSRIFYRLHITSAIEQFPDLVNDKYGIAMIVTHFFLSFPFFILLFINLYKTERIKEYILLAESLGASKVQSAFKIVVPMLLQKSLHNIILYFIFIFGAYEIPVLLGRSNPEMVSVLAVRKLQRFNLLDIPQGYAIAILYSVFVFALILIMMRKRKLAYDV